MSAQAVDSLALLPGYAAVLAAAGVLLADLASRRAWVAPLAAAGGVLLVFGAVLTTAGLGERETFCTEAGCSWQVGDASTVAAALFCLTALGVLALSGDLLRPEPKNSVPAERAPRGEYCFLLLCSLAGGIVLAYGRDVITILIAVETLTIPLYALVALRKDATSPRSRSGAESAATFLVISVSAGAVALLGAALLYGAAGTLHLESLAAGLEDAPPELTPLAAAGVALLISGLAFKIAAVPLHAWAPGVYDSAPLPIAAWLSTASKLGGALAVLWIASAGLGPQQATVGIVAAIVAAATMTVGNLGALRQRRAVRLLAWSSVAQAGYLLAPLGVFAVAAGREPEVAQAAAAAVLGFAGFYVLLELTAFAGLVGLRGADRDGGELEELRGAARRSRLPGAALILALLGLAGLPPGLAGLFAKVAVVSAVAGAVPWLALVLAVNAVVGLVYYLRFSLILAGAPKPSTPAPIRPTRAVLATAAAAATLLVVLGFAPQLLLNLVF